MTTRLTLALVGLTLMSASPFAASAHATAPDDSAAIEYLLEYVASSDMEFIRNGKSHTPAEAVEHMRRKYDYYAKKIHTAEDFIALAASESMISGKSYTVRIDDRELLAADWLTALLGDYRQENTTGESP